MTLERDEMLAVAQAFNDHLVAGEIDPWLELFAEDCSFRTSFMPEPIVGRDKLAAVVASWPKVLNQPEWRAIDGNRLVLGWSERLPSMKDETPSYRGISTLVFDDADLIVEYDGVFDTAAVIAAVSK